MRSNEDLLNLKSSINGGDFVTNVGNINIDLGLRKKVALKKLQNKNRPKN